MPLGPIGSHRRTSVRWTVALFVFLVLSIGVGLFVWLKLPVSSLMQGWLRGDTLTVTTLPLAQIRANNTKDVDFLRLAENPGIIVIDFASLTRQGHMLDRIAALTEKSRTPRNRILSLDETAAAIRQDGDMESGFYYGHDYSAASLARFFALADKDKVELTADETLLRRLLVQANWLEPETAKGLISIPRVGADAMVTDAVRQSILTHELAHGEYFSNRAYAQYVHRFWQTGLTDKERAAFRAYLTKEGYDVTNGEVVENEMQAYLLFTYDTRFFEPALVGMTPARRTTLRAAFRKDMPSDWLRDLLGAMP